VPAADRKPSLVERLFAEHGGALLAFFRRRIRSKADAPDLAQEVYLRMLRVSDQEAIRSPALYLYTVANNLVKEHAVLERRRASGVDIDEIAVHEQLEMLPTFDRDLDAAQRAAAAPGSVEAAQSEMPGRGAAALHAWALLPRGRDAPGSVSTDGKEVRRAGVESLSAPHVTGGLNR
jgi:DNA-directed RNA polymerase specialized sigma24 family protein